MVGDDGDVDEEKNVVELLFVYDFMTVGAVVVEAFGEPGGGKAFLVQNFLNHLADIYCRCHNRFLNVRGSDRRSTI